MLNTQVVSTCNVVGCVMEHHLPVLVLLIQAIESGNLYVCAYINLLTLGTSDLRSPSSVKIYINR